ncbi:homeobox-leucine zipper protein ROC2-like isoform X1 [Zingiber officinale]|uniref:homeobox-leucine zipper protein ROC2-like isoform X1 n=2 Tax=Zingiber officinale TaxID=94328 RepID=UPI001C4C7E36|nr:homeobox-leucine zipper protein ROC2-like isoform X1 [Zingiber officinale]XP_042439320.1 homeobox-leucine zipper protein ROC2-like isoform X1 [Zingiber officinale]
MQSIKVFRESCGLEFPRIDAKLQFIDMTEEHEQEEQQNGILNGSIMMDPLFRGILDDDDHFPNVLDINTLAASNVEQGVQNHGKRKINYRHTTEQIQQLEAFFQEFPHLDDKQRKELGQKLGLDPMQVKFWFQNKRTQMMNQLEREENQRLREENDLLLSDNLKLKEALNSACCPNCGGPPSLGEISIDEQQLLAENSRLRKQIERITAMVAKRTGVQLIPFLELNLPATVAGVHPRPGSTSNNKNLPEFGKPAAAALAELAMAELLALAQLGEPMWVRGPDGLTEDLNQAEYVRAFANGLGPKSVNLATEATRATAIVAMPAEALVGMLMDVEKWIAFFSGIVTGAATVEVYATGAAAGSYDGALQLMTAELQVPSPLVPAREGLFLRHCKQPEGARWAVVDVSFEVRHDTMAKFRRRPSGCIIQETPDGRSKVVWVEHVEADHGDVHALYKAIVNSGLAFGAKRWLARMERQCERLSSLTNSTAHIGNVEMTHNILNLSERMAMSFCSGVSGSLIHQWAQVTGAATNDVRIRSRKNNGDPGRPAGTVLSASTSIWLPISPKRVFDFLRSVPSRSQWDILLHGAMVYEAAAAILSSLEEDNCVSILAVGLPGEGNTTMILQETRSDSTCKYIIYSPVEAAMVNAVLGGEDSNSVALLPSGFAILPDEISERGGSLLTVALQIFIDSSPGSEIISGSIDVVNSLLSCTCDRIRAIMSSSNVQ